MRDSTTTAAPRRDPIPPILTTPGSKMSSCLEKVIEKLTAYKEGALTGIRLISSQKEEEPNANGDHVAEHSAPPEAKAEPGSCADGSFTKSCSSAGRPVTYLKREPFSYEGETLGMPAHCALHPSFQIKEEPPPQQDRGHLEPLEYRQPRSVHVKEEPRDGEMLSMEAPPYFSSRREDGYSTQSSMLATFPMFYPQHSEYGKVVPRKVHFLSHQLAPASEKPFCCSECGRCFSQRSYFLSHQRVHSGEHPFCCFHCGKSFRVKSGFDKHLRAHHQVENPFTCPLCHKSFMHRGHFLAHQRLHAEEEKFTCSLCGKSFIHHGHFLAHQRSHAEESRFSCPHCHKSFIHRGHFSAHLRVHTGEKPFICPDCGSSFSTHHNLVVHQRLHAGPTFTIL